MRKQRCKECQYYNDNKTCYRHKGLTRDIFDQCIDYECNDRYVNSNNRDSIENIVNDIANLVEMEKCFFEPKENYKLEILSRKLIDLVESHGIHSWKYD